MLVDYLMSYLDVTSRELYLATKLFFNFLKQQPEAPGGTTCSRCTEKVATPPLLSSFKIMLSGALSRIK